MNENNEIITGTGTTPEVETPMPTFEPAKRAPLFDPSNAYEKAIAKYLEANASDALMGKIREAKNAGFGIKECFEYITGEARKLAKNGCAMVEDDVVYGWAVHYFEDEWQARAREKAEAQAKREADKAAAAKKAEAEKQKEAARLAALTPEERELEERARAEAEAEKKFAEEDARRAKAQEDAKRRAEQRELKKLEDSAYEAAKAGEPLQDNPEWTKAQKAAVKAGTNKARNEIAAAKKAEREAKAAKKAEYEAAQGDLFAGLFN